MAKPALSRQWWLLPPGRLHPWWWVGVGVVLLCLEYFAGLDTQFPTVYVIPVALAAWYSGRWPAVALAVCVPVAHVAFSVARWNQSESLAAAVAMTTIRGLIVLVMALWFARLSEHERALDHHVHTLEGLLPICSFCKKIRNKAGEWERLEDFISERSEAQFSHSFCPACERRHYPDFVDDDVPSQLTN